MKIADTKAEIAASIQQESDLFFLDAIQSMSTDLLFRYDIVNDTMYYFGLARKELGLPEKTEEYWESLSKLKDFYPEDVQYLRNQILDMKEGYESSCDFRFRHPDGQWIWHRKEYRLRYDERGRLLEAIGRSCNVQAEKDMAEQINFDRLTGCYRKEIFEGMAADYLRRASQLGHALLIIDLDNFKAVNDNLGHLYGDRVLRSVGSKLKHIFRNTDLVGRIGGDEFMVLMKNVQDMDGITAKVKEVLKALDITLPGMVHDYHISASVGIALYPDHGRTFAQLYSNGDIALFAAKNQGKNAYTLYQEELSKGTMENTLAYDVATRALAQHFDYRTVAECFTILFENDDLNDAINQALSLLGLRFQVSRSYVFEYSTTNIDSYNNTYEWCAHGVPSERERLQNVPLSLFQPFFSLANDDGIIYCNDLEMLGSADAQAIMEVQNIQSFLHAYIRSGDKFTYVIGFDDCTVPRVWSALEIATLLHASKMIAQFINYKNAIQMARTVGEERLQVLDSLNYAAYIIDIQTHQLTYFNHYTQEKCPNLKLGDVCYKSIRGLDAPCADCSLNIMTRAQKNHARHIIYNDILQDHFIVNASRLTSFEGKESIFVAANELGWVTDAQHITPKINL